MKTVNTKLELKDLDGNPIKDGNEILTVGRALSAALVGEQKKGMSPTEASDRYALAMDMRAKETVKLKSEQVTTCKQALVNCYGALVSGQVIKILGE